MSEEIPPEIDLQALINSLPLPPEIDDNISKLDRLLIDYDTNSDHDLLPKIRDLAEEVATQLRDLRYRGSVGSKTEIIRNIIKTINKIVGIDYEAQTNLLYPCTSALTHLLRIIGNTVHTCDDNRGQCIDAGGALALRSAIDLLLKLDLKHNSFCEDEIQIAVIVTTNLCLDYPRGQVALAEAGLTVTLSRIIEYAYQRRFKWMSFPLILLEELCEIDEGWSQIPESLLCTLAKMIIFYSAGGHSDDAKEQDLNLQIVVLCSHILEMIVDHAGPFRFTSWLFVPSETMWTTSDDPPTPMWLRLLMFLHIGHHSKEAISGTIESEESLDLAAVVKTHIARSLVLAVAHTCLTIDGKQMMFDCLIDLIDKKNALTTRVDLLIMVGLWLGNLACDEESCQMLVEDYRILDHVVKVFKTWSPSRLDLEPGSASSKAKPGQQVQVLHAWCGLARNLAVADTYKERLGDLGMVTYALECLRPEFDIVAPLNVSAAALLRHLCRNHPGNAQRVLNSNRIDAVVKLAGRVEQLFLVLESCRLLSVLVTAANIIVDQSDSKALTEGMKVLFSESTTEALVRFAYFSVASDQLLLINEAIVALTLLSVRPELTHLLCNSLIKTRAPTGSSSASLEPEVKNDVSEDHAEPEEQYPTALEALLSILIPKDKQEDPLKEKNPTDDQEKQNEVDDEHEGIESDENKIGTKVGQKNAQQKRLETPVQIQHNLYIMLTQLGNQVTRTQDSIVEAHDGFSADLKKIKDLLRAQFDKYHSELTLNLKDSGDLANPVDGKKDEGENNDLKDSSINPETRADGGVDDEDEDAKNKGKSSKPSKPKLSFLDVLKSWGIDL